jgi:uncharacterized protein (TIGR01244 family)
VLTLLVVAALVGVPQAQAQEPLPIRAFMQVTPDFCTAGQPAVTHYELLKARGVKTVLNLRTPGEHRWEEEKKLVEDLGMKYINIPVAYKEPKDSDVDEFLKVTDDPANRPMLIHCTAAIRAGAFWMIRRIVRDGMTWDAAFEEAKKAGFVNAPHLEEFVKKYVETHKK